MALNRRAFLRALGLSGVGLGISVTMAQGKPAGKGVRKDLSAIKLTGVVRANAKGVAGVAVTDGINITYTDAKGNYILNSNAVAEFVYISAPKGYAFNHQHGITGFYKRIENAKGSFKADFDLQKLTVDDTRHNFIVWADPQIQNAEDAALLNSQSAPDTFKLVNSYPKETLFHGIGCGDLVWDKFELFADYKEAVKKTGIPFFQVIGNHDMDIDARTDDYSSKTFKEHFGPSYYSYNRGDVHYVTLDDVFFLGASKKYIGYISEQQFAWLEQDLAQVKPGATVVVSLHIPVNTGAKRRNKLDEEPIGGVVSNRKELYRLLKPFKAHIMSGHTHFNEKVIHEGTIEHVHGTVCGAWWTGPICYDGTPNGYAVYEVNGSEIQWYHKAVGHEKDYQLRIYPVGAVKDKPDYFSVNVWNWDPQWKVEWFEDGKSMGELQQEITFDPLSVALHEGAEKPSKRGWVDPVLTDHMFFGKPSANADKIIVQATDRFKNVYKKEIRLSELKLQS
ncbi:calcineurin-like phosphoesterase C-terminal domain-containing protein [Ohtaekwangia koreensis]|uniref:Calcineurin-like phosphoesterase n=1 Tax=Ohtaekwangia koreensis TaxID=688867 RepID=A0A1T5M710_9BACT|nr:calcineurin-like phosphoesterase family protein [Ohtaekwangia koreensis]SKC84017.1 Calcineurin-like phosphoesterase [Ohtaekwangia koreensis]